MGKSLAEMLQHLPESERTAISARTDELVAEELTLRDLRKALDQTQVAVAKKLHIGQDSVSRLEKRSDLLLSTLRGYIEAMGGRLELLARFPDRPTIKLTGLADIEDGNNA
jgi:hypothetical protein